jgi:hypothetical protein
MARFLSGRVEISHEWKRTMCQSGLKIPTQPACVQRLFQRYAKGRQKRAVGIAIAILFKQTDEGKPFKWME